MKSHSKLVTRIALIASGLLSIGFIVHADPPDSTSHPPKITEKSFTAANELKMTVRMVAPYAAETDLQIICVFKHGAAGDKYVASMKDFDEKVRGLLSSLRNRGEFAGELGETILFHSWPGSITPKRVLVVGLGPEKDLSLDTLRIVGRVALREAVRLKATDVAFAPTIRDQGNSTIDVGEGDRAVAEQVLLAYDTEKRLQVEGVADSFSIREWVIEAGPAFIEGAIEKVGMGVESASAEIRSRDRGPYRKGK